MSRRISIGAPGFVRPGTVGFIDFRCNAATHVVRHPDVGIFYMAGGRVPCYTGDVVLVVAHQTEHPGMILILHAGSPRWIHCGWATWVRSC